MLKLASSDQVAFPLQREKLEVRQGNPFILVDQTSEQSLILEKKDVPLSRGEAVLD